MSLDPPHEGLGVIGYGGTVAVAAASRYWARIGGAVGAVHQKAVRSTASGTPRQTTACPNPNCWRIWGIWAT